MQIVLHQGDYSSIQEWIRTGAVDFGFVNPHAVKGLETMVVKSGQFRAVVPVGHPLAERMCYAGGTGGRAVSDGGERRLR